MTEEDLERADDRAFLTERSFGVPSIGSPLKKETGGWRYARRCSFAFCKDPTAGWEMRVTTGKSEKSRLADSVPACRACGHPWERWEAVGYQVRGNERGGFDGGARAARIRPGVEEYPDQVIHVSQTRPHSSSSELRILGEGVGANIVIGVNRIARTFRRSPPWYWHAQVYFAYVIHVGGRRGHGGLRHLAEVAAQRWPKAPHAWNYNKARELMLDGRIEWARRLAREDLLWNDGSRRWNGKARRGCSGAGGVDAC